ncbi:DUF3888 domain-containing protein [Aquibacillus koreensis]|uniref:DUF3888 domain-containing protein n=1 Tax=Aquibacillus koreensis TaxID=279446 RepID=A0A9X3WJB9_9BACI|nr:DUF3888 domain-containing protein [Aquibacillus koreensis]MCT2536521.1 DUF3888 domain-containing protein [Aquibacillus koreensis]MDC3419391.1 DUF3888 domain-containing protein [Aquibacillus koreensis]
MKKLTAILTLTMILVSYDTPAFSQTINEADTELCETLKYALINSLREPIDKAIFEIYKDDEDAPEGLRWDSYDTEILKIKQLYGVGGAYELTLKVKPFYRAHITYGEDIIVVSADGELIDYEHLKTYPRVYFN